MPAAEAPSLLAPTSAASLPLARPRVLLFSPVPLAFPVEPDPREFDLVARLVGGEGKANRPKIADALREAREAGCSVVLLPTDTAVGVSPRVLMEEVVPAFEDAGVRLRSLSAAWGIGAPPFDTANAAYMSGFRAAVAWPRPTPRHWPACGRCRHRCVRPGSKAKGHTLAGEYGDERPGERCDAEPCGCLHYEEENERAMGRRT